MRDRERDRKTSLLTAVWNYLPQGKLKESLRRFYHRHNNCFYALNKVITRAELTEGEASLFVELNNGMRFYSRGDGISHPLLDHGKAQKLDKIREFKYFGDFLEILEGQFCDNIYELSQFVELNKGDTVVDVGAHVGVFTVKAAKAIGHGGKVIAIEPEEDNLIFLQRNVKENKLTNVKTILRGVWSEKDKLRLYLDNLSKGSAGYSLVNKGKEFIEVEVDTLDSILRESGVKKVDFIKMDIEGGEIEALKGMEETLKNNDVKLAIAAYHIVNEKRTHKVIVPQLKEMEFEVHVKDGIVYGRKKQPIGASTIQI